MAYLSVYLPIWLPAQSLAMHSLPLIGVFHMARQIYCVGKRASHVFLGSVFGGRPDGMGGIYSVGCFKKFTLLWLVSHISYPSLRPQRDAFSLNLKSQMA